MALKDKSCYLFIVQLYSQIYIFETGTFLRELVEIFTWKGVGVGSSLVNLLKEALPWICSKGVQDQV